MNGNAKLNDFTPSNLPWKPFTQTKETETVRTSDWESSKLGQKYQVRTIRNAEGTIHEIQLLSKNIFSRVLSNVLPMGERVIFQRQIKPGEPIPLFGEDQRISSKKVEQLKEEAKSVREPLKQLAEEIYEFQQNVTNKQLERLQYRGFYARQMTAADKKIFEFDRKCKMGKPEDYAQIKKDFEEFKKETLALINTQNENLLRGNRRDYREESEEIEEERPPRKTEVQRREESEGVTEETDEEGASEDDVIETERNKGKRKTEEEEPKVDKGENKKSKLSKIKSKAKDAKEGIQGLAKKGYKGIKEVTKKATEQITDKKDT